MKTVIEMAREAGAGEPESLYGRTDYVVMTKFELERFAELVRADEREKCEVVAKQAAREAIVFAMDAEREACAKLAEERGWYQTAAAIRARKTP